MDKQAYTNKLIRTYGIKKEHAEAFAKAANDFEQANYGLMSIDDAIERIISASQLNTNDILNHVKNTLTLMYERI